MYTQCPHCQTCFRIAEDHLKIANGKVRCGSCQEVFDATQHLFKNLTDREPITFNPAKSAPRPTPPTRPASSNVSSSPEPEPKPTTTPPTPAVEKLVEERKKAPDQGPFMESTIGSDRYNNLDQMQPIDIPGQIDFGDSIIKLPDEDKPPAAGKSPAPDDTEHDLEQPELTESPSSPAASKPGQAAPSSRTMYEDVESKEAPVTEAEQETLENFFAEVDAQLDGSEDKSQLDKDIDELLAFAKGIEQVEKPDAPDESSPIDIDISAPDDTPAADTQGIEVSEEFDLQAIADFEKELEASNPGVFSRGAEDDKSAQTRPDDTSSSPAPASEEITSGEDEPARADEPQAATASAKAKDESAAQPGPKTHAEENEHVPRALRDSLHMLNNAPRRSLGKTLLMALLILLLLGGLGFQVVLFRNVELAHKFPALAPTLSKICARIPCRYSGKVDVSQIKLLNRDVRSDPNQANALLISATFVDKAPFDQPYPIIKITLYDLGGNVVASRRFTPKEYLQKMYNRFLLMESGTPVHITLAVLDPGKDAINFEFTFLRPDRTW